MDFWNDLTLGYAVSNHDTASSDCLFYFLSSVVPLLACVRTEPYAIETYKCVH